MPSLPLVPRQPPVASLNAEAQQALADLQRQQKITKRLTHHLAQAAEQLATVATQLNDRGTNYNLAYRKKRRRGETHGEEDNEEEKVAYEDFQRKLQDLTWRMDNGVRSVVDDQTWVDALPEIMKQMARKAQASAEASQTETQLIDSEDNDEVTRTEAPPPTTEEVPSALIKTAREELASDWASKTLTERYSQNNTYVGFYRSVHDAKNPGEDGPPIPHHSLWFASEEDVNATYVAPGTTIQRSRRPRGPSNEGDEDGDISSSDVEIAREKISIKCPITYLPFTDPLTSTKCPHSFDKPGITAMLHRTTTSLPLTDAQTAELAAITDARARNGREAQFARTPAVPCPVCSTLLAHSDLLPDPVLLRKVRRIQAAEAREREAATSDLNSNSDDSDDEDGVIAPGKGTQRKPVGLGSSPAPVSARGKKMSALEIKRERARSKSRAISVVPQTQVEGGEDEEVEDD